MIQSAIEFFIKNNVAVIQIGFAILFFLAVYIILKSFREDKKTEPKLKPIPRKSYKEEFATPQPKEAKLEEQSPLDDLDNLDDLIAMDEKAAAEAAPVGETSVATGAATVTSGATATPAASAQAAPNTELQKNIEEKEKVISDLKKEMASIQEKMQDKGNTAELEAKIKELSEKLTEYEIIEDDIANLSFYKNENVKLKNELDQIKGTSSSEAPMTAPSAQAPSPVAGQAVVAKNEAVQESENESVLEEFEKAVQQKEALENLAKTQPQTAKPEVTPTPTAQAPTAPATEQEKTLEVDSKKLVQEIENLAKNPAPAAPSDDGKDSTQKLIEEFESFMNKASS